MPMKAAPLRRAFVPPQADGRILTPTAPEFSVSGLMFPALAEAAAAWPSANDPMALSFTLTFGGYIRQLGWLNGAGTMTDNADFGIYDLSWNRLVSTGSVARAGVSTWQWTNVTDTAIAPGRYYAAMSCNGVTAGQQAWYGQLNNTDVAKLVGTYDSATDAFALPNPLTNMALAATFGRVPVVGIAFRTPFV